MFLDDVLYLHIKNREIKEAKDMQTCISECYKLCEDYYKSKLPPLVGCSYKDITRLMDKTFKFWDMAIAKLEKENWWGVDIFKIPGASFKDSFLSNPELKRMYELGK